MKKLSLDDILGLERYEQQRVERRAGVISLKRHRRVALGDRVTFVFENRDTILFQVQEMLRAERIVDLDKVREELAVYNALIPEEGELSATLFIEITEGDVRSQLAALLGIDEHVRIDIGDAVSIPAVFEPGRSTDEKLSAVQYVRFRVPESARRLWSAGDMEVRLVIDHPGYRHSTRLDAGVRASLGADLAATEWLAGEG